MLDWDDLRFVLAVARTGTLSGAARALSVEHTTVGRRLASIERALGVRLFDRTPDGHVPTTTGTAVIAHAGAVEDHVLALEREVAGSDARVEGIVRITALDAFIADLLLPNLGELSRRHPMLQIVAASEVRMVSLERREADIAIRWRAPDDPGFVARPLAEVGSGLYASREYVAARGHPRGPSELEGHDRIGYGPELAHSSEERWLAENAPGARVAVRVGSPVAYRAAIEEGLGVGVYECHSAERAGLVRLWDEPVLEERWWAVVHADIVRAARIRATLDFLTDITESNRERIAGRRRRRAVRQTAPVRRVRRGPHPAVPIEERPRT
jgi:DNA-binding transcriptional LysR family regulator